MRKILILGSTGMLGNAVAKHFLMQNWCKTYLTFRNPEVAFGPESQRIKFDIMADRFDLVNFSEYSHVINCIGTIKPFMAKDPIAAREINSVFPWKLANICNLNNSKLIHITTDCVYSGNKGKYVETDSHDALDDYGKSKSLGEPVDRCMVVRTSIIGEEIHKNASLIEWAKSQKGKEIKGFTNHLWNGITTKQYAKVCEQIILDEAWETGLFHVHSSDIVSKFDMMTYFNEKFDLNLTINPVEATPACDRSLSSIKNLCERLHVPTVKNQIMDI